MANELIKVSQLRHTNSNFKHNFPTKEFLKLERLRVGLLAGANTPIIDMPVDRMFLGLVSVFAFDWITFQTQWRKSSRVVSAASKVRLYSRGGEETETLNTTDSLSSRTDTYTMYSQIISWVS